MRISKFIYSYRRHMKLLPFWKDAALLLLNVILVFGITAGTQVYATDDDNEILGTVYIGSFDNRIVLSITNPSTESSIENAKLEVVNNGRWIKNIRIKADKAGPIAPKSSRRFTILFDISSDAEKGAIDKATFRVSAQGALVDNPNPTLTIKIKEDSEGLEGTEGTQGPLVMKLVEIIGPSKDHGYVLEYKEGEPGATARYEYFDEEEIISVRLTEVPMEIVLGEPFSFAAEIKKRITYKPGFKCINKNEPTDPMDASPRLSTHGYAVRATQDLHAYCSEKGNGKKGIEKDGSVNMRVTYTPLGKETENKKYHPYGWTKILKYFYRVDVSTNGVLTKVIKVHVERMTLVRIGITKNGRYSTHYETTTGRKEDHRSVVNLGAGGKSRKYRQLLYGRKVVSAGITLRYRLIQEGDTYLASIPNYEHPAELNRPPRDGTEEIQVADKDGIETEDREEADSIGVEEIDDTTGFGEQEREKPINPDNVDPNNKDVAGAIREWISVAEPPANATDGANLHYDKWGRAIGTGGDGVKFIPKKKPDYAIGTPEKTIWSLREKLDSVNHCTLKEYVLSKLEGRSIENCRGRYQKIGNLRGESLDEAKTKLSIAGFKYTIKKGSEAPSKWLEGTIESHKPGPGKGLKRGGTVALTVYSPCQFIRVPNLVNKTLSAAKKVLLKAGLVVKPKISKPAPSQRQEYRVIGQKPGSGEEIKKGQSVTLTIYGPFSQVTVPNVRGKKLQEAKTLLKKVGLTAKPEIKTAAGSKDQEFKVISQNPAVGKKVKPGETITLSIYGPISLVTVPNVRGKKLGQAKSLLKNAGLSTRSEMGPKAGSKAQELTVISQNPAPGTKSNTGKTVVLTIYGKYGRVSVPNVINMETSLAKKILNKAGFRVSMKNLGAAPTPDKSNKVKEHKPGAGSVVEPGSEIRIFTYGRYKQPTGSIEDIILAGSWTYRGSTKWTYNTGVKIPPDPGRLKFSKVGVRIVGKITKWLKLMGGSYRVGDTIYELLKKVDKNTFIAKCYWREPTRDFNRIYRFKLLRFKKNKLNRYGIYFKNLGKKYDLDTAIRYTKKYKNLPRTGWEKYK